MACRDELNFAIIGAGNVGKAMAAHLSILGYNVSLYNRTEERIRSLMKCKEIQVCGVIEGDARIKTITTDIRKAITDAKIIMVTVPASEHKLVANSLGPYLRNDQIIILNPGRTLGSLEFSHILNMYGKRNIVSETQTIIYTTRSDNKCSEIFAIKRKVPLASFPACRTGEVMDYFKNVYPEFSLAKDILETGFSNVGSVMHPAPTLLNTGWIENRNTPFKYYYNGITPTIAKYLEAIDGERVEIAREFGYRVPTVREWLHEAYGCQGNNLFEALQNNEAYRMIDAPETIYHRYIFEDVPTGLVPLSSLSSVVQMPVPHITALIDLASQITTTDFWDSGRTIGSCGLSDMTRDEIVDFVSHGPNHDR